MVVDAGLSVVSALLTVGLAVFFVRRASTTISTDSVAVFRDHPENVQLECFFE